MTFSMKAEQKRGYKSHKHQKPIQSLMVLRKRVLTKPHVTELSKRIKLQLFLMLGAAEDYLLKEI